MDDSPANIKKSIPGHVLEFTPSDFSAALKLCNEIEGVLEVQTYGERLHVFVDDVSKRKPQIESTLDSQNIAHDNLREIEVRMEEAFISLIRRQKESVEQDGISTSDAKMLGDIR